MSKPKVDDTYAAKVEYTNAGVKFRGDWEEICIFARSMEIIMEQNFSDEDAIEKYHEWRPKEKENEDVISQKTAEEACIEKKNLEDDYDGAKEELGEAGEKIKKGVAKVGDEDESSTENIKEASKKIERVVGAESIKSIRRLEKLIYQGVMLKFNPYYFDTEEFSVCLKKKEDGEEENDYVLSINISNDDLRDEVRHELNKRADN